MKNYWKEIWRAIAVTILLCVVVSGIYPVVIWGFGQLLFNKPANGSLMVNGNTVIGSELLAQGFTDSKYFHPRPSAAGNGPAGNPGWDTTSSAGFNYGPTNQKLIDQVKGFAEQYRKENNLPADAVIPADAATASASGLDPHVSPRNAELQESRVAKARNLSEDQVRRLIEDATDRPLLGFLGGASGVNVMRLNRSLDALTSTN